MTPNGSFMLATLARYDIDVAGVETVSAPTQVALIMVGGGDNQIVVVPGANMHIDASRVASLPLAKGDICVAQGETTVAVVRNAFTRARERRAVTMFNPAPAAEVARELLTLADIIVVNEVECEFFAGTRFDLARPELSLADARQRAQT